MNTESSPSNQSVHTSASELEGLIDPSRLKDLAEYDDEQFSMTREVLDLFIQQVAPSLEEIKACLALQDAARLRKITHTLRGAASNVGAEALSAACAHLEESCNPADSSDPLNASLKAYVWPHNAQEQYAQIERIGQRSLEAFNQLDLSTLMDA